MADISLHSSSLLCLHNVYSIVMTILYHVDDDDDEEEGDFDVDNDDDMLAKLE